jgi:hypothetical protein
MSSDRQIDMNPVLANSPDAPFAHKDAVYFSGHKFVGGPGLSLLIPVSSHAPRIIGSSDRQKKNYPFFKGATLFSRRRNRLLCHRRSPQVSDFSFIRPFSKFSSGISRIELSERRQGLLALLVTSELDWPFD